MRIKPGLKQALALTLKVILIGVEGIVAFFIGAILNLNIFGKFTVPIYVLSMLLLSLIIFPLFKNLLPQPWGTLRKVGAYAFTVCTVVVFGKYFNEFRATDSLNYQLGNCSGSLSRIAQNIVGQKVLKSVISVLPLSAQMILIEGEDACRVLLIKELSEKTKPCGEENAVNCIYKLYEASSSRAPYGSTGLILSLATGSSVIAKNLNSN